MTIRKLGDVGGRVSVIERRSVVDATTMRGGMPDACHARADASRAAIRE